jgi:two-component system osmolarity sensor histidine kinase EnvZ
MAMRFIRKFIPRTLLVRTFVLVSLLIFVSVATWLTLFGLAEREPRARQLAQLAVSVVNLTRAALVAADPVKRLELLRDLAESEGVHLYPAEAGDLVTPLPDTFFFSVMYRTAKSELESTTRFAGSVNGQAGIWVSFSISDSDEDEYWLMLPGEHAERDFPWHWLGWGSASLALALLVAWLIVSRVALPLRTLAAAASEVGRGRHPEPIPERGAIELRQLAEAFNRMSRDLKRLDAERAEVLAGISHDLRTPLARLRLESEMSIGDELARNAAIDDIEQMDAIIAQFLDYARSEDGEKAQPTDLDALITQLANSRGRASSAPQLILGSPPRTLIYRQALARAIANLLENARKYGGNQIAVKTHTENGDILIDVLDRGPGIEADQMENMKRPFTRLDSARTDATGTGLGLAIVERIARLHEGSLELLPRDGGGLIARLRLPIKD